MKPKFFVILCGSILLLMLAVVFAYAAYGQENPPSVLPPQHCHGDHGELVPCHPGPGSKNPVPVESKKKLAVNPRLNDARVALTPGPNNPTEPTPHRHQPPAKQSARLKCHNAKGQAVPCVKLSLNASRLPKHNLTPGAVSSRTLKDICSVSTKNYRATSAKLKAAICKEYNVTACPSEGKMEIDHLVPLELGGADEQRNLWVQTAPDYHKKDLLENKLHALVCGKTMDLDAARYCISTDWVACYQKTFGVKP